MKAERPLINTKPAEPSAVSGKEFGGMVARQAPIPQKDLLQYWIDNPAMLRNRLRNLSVRPARVCNHLSTCRGVYQAINDLVGDGLVERAADEKTADIVILGCTSPSEESELERLLKMNVVVIPFVIKEDHAEFVVKDVVFPFAGNKYDEAEVGRHLRDVLFRIRDRLDCTLHAK